MCTYPLATPGVQRFPGTSTLLELAHMTNATKGMGRVGGMLEFFEFAWKKMTKKIRWLTVTVWIFQESSNSVCLPAFLKLDKKTDTHTHEENLGFWIQMQILKSSA